MEKTKCLVASIIQKIEWFPPLLARIIIAYVFVQAGWGKIHHLPHVIDYFKSLGIPAAQIQAPFVAWIEVIGGACIGLGLMTRLISLPLIGTMVVALITAKRPEIHTLMDLFGMSEFLYAVILSWLFTAGPSCFSIDRFICPLCKPSDSACSIKS